MSVAWTAAVARVPARQLHLLGAGLLLCAGAAAWFLALRPPLSSLRALRADAARLQAQAPDTPRLAARLAALDASSAALGRRFGKAATSGRQELDLVGAAGRLAAAHGVLLHGAEPAQGQPVAGFAPTSLDAAASGGYASLLAWMADIENAGPGISIGGYEMSTAKEAGKVDIKLRVVAWRVAGGVP